MQRITLKQEPAIEECVLCKNNHNCWGCDKFSEVIEQLWKLENQLESNVCDYQ